MNLIQKKIPTICLNMIVKNESHIIEDTLEKLCKKINFDYWVISDTGSTDNTIEKITKFFKNKNIKGEIFEDKWKDFAHNRSLALNYAYNKTDYLLIFDADDELVGDFQFPDIIQTTEYKDAYHLGFGSEIGTSYYRVLLINNRKKWRYRSVVHEFIECLEPHTDYPHLSGNYYVISGRTSARNKNPNKFIDDAITLENAYKVALETKDDLYLRYAYYCANSYFDAKKFEDAIKWYKTTLSQPNWAQEKYNSCLHIFYAYQSLNQIENGIYYLIESISYDKRRVECIYELIKYYCENNKFDIAYLFYNQYKHNTNNKYLLKENSIEDGLFLKNHLFYFFYQYYAVTILQKLNLLEDGYEMYETIFKNKTTVGGEFALNNLINNFSLYKDYFKTLTWNNDRKVNFINNMLEFIEICNEEKIMNISKGYIHKVISSFLNDYSDLFTKENTEIKNMLVKKKNIQKEINELRNSKSNETKTKIILTFTTCKRLDLFQKTMNSILNNWTDLKLVDTFFCVDDNSTLEDRKTMEENYSFIEFYFKSEEEKGHRQSMNIIWNKLNEVKPDYWIHLEDDWLFFRKQNYIEKSINILKKYNESIHKVSQVLFNINYAETYDIGWDINGGIKLEKGVLLHEKTDNITGRNCAYWPHYSFRPSLIDVKTILQLGNFDSPNTFFERDYADRYFESGYKSCFFYQVTSLHTGKLTSESNTTKPNAYSLNNLNQFNSQNMNDNENTNYLEEWVYFPVLDSMGQDIYYLKGQDKNDLLKVASKMQSCVAVNTLGFFKSSVSFPLVSSQYFSQQDGIYIKKTEVKKITKSNVSEKTKVKLIGSWCTSRDLCFEWNNMSKGKFEWDNIEITWDDNADFFVIINKPSFNEFYIPERTIVFQMEPWCYNETQNWGVKTWGKWTHPEDEQNFLQVRNHLNFYNNGFWQVNVDYNTFKNKEIIKSEDHEYNNTFSTICTSKYFDPGHIKRIDFLKFVESKKDPEVNFHLFNHDNKFTFNSYKGKASEKVNKEIGLLPYKYYFMCENNAEYNFITEKIWESILCECLVFYWGCPNVSDYINPLAYVQLDMEDFEKSFETIKNAFKTNLWEQRISIIREEKQKILDYYSFFPTVHRTLFDDFKFSKHPSNDEIMNINLFLKNIINLNLYKLPEKTYKKNVCFIHSCTMDNYGTEMLDEIISKIEKSELFSHLDYIIVNNIGTKINKRKYAYNKKIKITNHSSNTELFEIDTLKLIHKFSELFTDINVLYMHTKGISYQKNTPIFKNVNDWKDTMMYFLIDKFENCLQALKYNDSVGINYHSVSSGNKDTPHWSGNYWWSKTNYIKNLSIDSLKIKHDAEWWILSRKGVKYAEVFNTHTNHYINDYPKLNYKEHDELTKDEIEKNEDLIKNIYVINLEKRTDRKEKVVNLLLEQNINNYEFFKAIDGSKLELTDEIYNLFKNNDFGNRKGFIACALSHLSLLKQLVNSEEEYYIIMEDDITFCDNFKTELIKNIVKIKNNKEIDFLYLGYHFNKKYENDRFTWLNHLTRIDNHEKYSICGNFGYIVTKLAATKLLNYINKNGIRHGIDYLIKIIPDLNNMLCQPNIVFSEWVMDIHSNVNSDIQMDHSRFDFSKYNKI